MNDNRPPALHFTLKAGSPTACAIRIFFAPKGLVKALPNRRYVETRTEQPAECGVNIRGRGVRVDECSHGVEDHGSNVLKHRGVLSYNSPQHYDRTRRRQS